MSCSCICAAFKFDSNVMAVYIVEALNASCTFMFLNIINKSARAISSLKVPSFVSFPPSEFSQEKKKKFHR